MSPRRAQIVAIAALVAALALLAAGCGEKSENLGASPQRFDLALDFYPNPDHAGIYEGLRKGFFKDAGLDLMPHNPSDPSSPIKQVAAGRADLAISYEPELLLARDQGLDVVAVGALVNRPLTSLISLDKANITSVRDLKGKKVATAGIPYQAKFLQAILHQHGLRPSDIHQVDVAESLLPAILSGKVDAMFGGYPNVEGVDLTLRGKRPRIVPADKLGVPTYDELVLVAQGKRLSDDPQSIRLFIAALARGTKAAERDPKGVTKALLNAEKGLDPKLTAAEVKRTLPLLEPQNGKPFGYMDPGQWRQFSGWMVDNNLLKARPDLGNTLTNQYLPRRAIP
jgi:putative hydroxymethylpyrimidine transport system substrate-binding protein